MLGPAARLSRVFALILLERSQHAVFAEGPAGEHAAGSARRCRRLGKARCRAQRAWGVEPRSMTPAHSEVERKYDVTDDVDIPALEQLPHVVRVETQELELDATYFDTDALDLAAAGITLRRRTGGDDEGWHLKLPTRRGDERQELHLPLSRATKTPPKLLRDTVQVHTRRQTLKQVADIRTHRTVHALHGETGDVLALFCDDTVTAPTPAPEDSGLLLAWREWEVELVEGPADLLADTDSLVRDAGATPAAGPSKLARVLGDRVPHDDTVPVRLRSNSPAAAVALTPPEGAAGGDEAPRPAGPPGPSRLGAASARRDATAALGDGDVPPVAGPRGERAAARRAEVGEPYSR